MKEKIDSGQIRMPYLTPDERQKTTKLVRFETLAKVLDERALEAELEFARLWS